MDLSPECDMNLKVEQRKSVKYPADTRHARIRGRSGQEILKQP